jgi:hypothetical protein
MVDLAFHEWIGLIAYRLFHKTDAVFPSELKLVMTQTEVKPQVQEAFLI